MTMHRATFLASALAAASIAQARAADLTPLRCASAPDDDVSAFLYARDTGAFRKSGLDVSIQKSNSGAAVAAAVAGGSIDIGKSSILSLIAAHQRGLPFVIVAAAGVYDADHPDVAMLAAKDGPVKSPKDLVGRVVAVPALSDLYTISNDAIVDAATHGGWKDVKYLEMPSASAPDAVASHRVDAVTLATPTLEVALAAGKVQVIAHPFDAIGKHFLRAAWFATKDYVAKNADTVQRFRATLERASADVNAHPAATVATMAAFSGQDAQVLGRMPRALAGTTLDARFVQPVIDAAFKYGAIASGFEAHEIFATTTPG